SPNTNPLTKQRQRSHLGNDAQLTNATLLLSGDHDGTLIVPCPPNSCAIVLIFLSASVISRNITSLFSGCPLTLLSYVKNTMYFPSGEMCGNQLLFSSVKTCSCSLPSAFMRQICICPVRFELK